MSAHLYSSSPDVIANGRGLDRPDCYWDGRSKVRGGSEAGCKCGTKA